jgi:hypothetical protein
MVAGGDESLLLWPVGSQWLQPIVSVINQMNVIESCVFVFPFFIVLSCRGFVPTHGGLIPS